MIGKYDAAVIDRQDGKPHIVRRVDTPATDELANELTEAVRG